MRIQLIQQKVPIGSQIILKLRNDDEVSGLLTEIGLDYITLEIANRQKTILVDAILMFEVQDEDNQVEVKNLLDGRTDSTEADRKEVETSAATKDSTDSDTDTGQIETFNSTEAITAQGETSDLTCESTDSSDTISEQNEKPNPTEAISVQVETSELTDDSINSLDTISEQNEKSNPTEVITAHVEASNPIDTNIESTDTVSIEQQASKQLDEIEDRFQNEIENTNIELEPPDVTFPAEELMGWQKTSVAGKWLQIKNKYENAQRINELSVKFGRIQPLLMEVKSLVRRFPISPALKRVTAYFYAVSDDWQQAIQLYQEVAITSEDINDWFNVAVSALNMDRVELTCYSLEKYFKGVSVIDNPNAWSIYVNLVEKFNNLFAFREQCTKDENDVNESEIEVLLDAAIYLFKKKVTTELATEIVIRRIKGEPVISLLKEVCQQLGGQSTESYRQSVSEFMTEMITSEKRIDPLAPEYPEHPGLVRKGADHLSSLKQDVQTQNEDPYASAKRADVLEKDLDKADHLYRECIKRNIRYESAIKDLAMVLVRLGRSEEAVELLEENRQRVEDKQALDNVLINVYSAAAQYEKTVDLLNNTLKQGQNQNQERRLQIRMQIANAYIKLENYVSAESEFHLIQKLRPHNVTVQREGIN